MALLENISSLKIKGGLFEAETELPLFVKDKQQPRFSLLYGKNGTGKSTISRAFMQLAGSDEKQIVTAEILDAQRSPISITDELRNSIYVYNEDFVDKNIRIDGDGLNTIVVMGALKDIDDEIKSIEPNYLKSKDLVEKQKAHYEQYTDSKNSSSPDYYIEEMHRALKGDDNWAGRDARIFEKKTNSPVKKDTYLQFLKIAPQKKRDELIVDFNTTMKQLEEARMGRRRIEKNVPKLAEYVDIEKNVICLLGEKIERPELSEREQKIFSLLQKENGAQRLDGIKNFFAEKKEAICPFCFQEIKKEYAEKLITSIEKILSKKVEEHQQKLHQQKIQRYEIDLEEFKQISEAAVEKCENALKILNAEIDNINGLLEKKIGNVYETICVESFALREKYDNCVFELTMLEKERENYNAWAVNTTPLMNQLRDINSAIAFYDIAKLYEVYLAKTKEKSKEGKKLKEYEEERDKWKIQIDKKIEEKKNIKIAMDAINEDLAYIFFSKGRLSIEHKDDKYILYSHGKSVEPCNVSVGERNAIGLCYFFNRIMENRDEEEFLKQSYLLVIDDPVSSFDMENRIGILSYLKYKLNQFMQGNKESRFLITTHDMQTFYDIKHVIDEILAKLFEVPNILPGKASDYLRQIELKNNCLEKIDIRSRHEYTVLFETVYDYAVDIEPAQSMSIGNTMRKIMEAFGTFVYKKGMAELSTNKKILEAFEESDKIYFENLMYRLVLNTGSHMEEKTKTIADMKFFDYISDEDKQRTARDIICFLYKLNPLHVIAHLEKKDNAVQKINEWCKEIAKR